MMTWNLKKRKRRVKSLKTHIEEQKNLEEFEEDLLAKEESADESEINEEDKWKLLNNM